MFDKLLTNLKIPQLDSDVEPVDLLTAFKASLDAPLFYPPLNQSVFPGDRVAILLQANLPRPVDVLAALLDCCWEANVASSDVDVVISPVMASQFDIPADQLKRSESDIATGAAPKKFDLTINGKTIGCQVHDPENQHGLAYLAAGEVGDPIYVNRLLADADVVLPVGCPTPGANADPINCLYPEFGSANRRTAFRAATGSVEQRNEEVELANNQLGIFFSIEVVFAPGGDVVDVISGARADVIKASADAASRLWTYDFTPGHDAILATIEESGRAHDWQDFASAVIAAGNISDGSGPIVIWSNIEAAPDRNIRKALLSQFEDGVNAKISRQYKTVASIVSERPVFLKSQQPQSVIEELGLGFVQDQAEAIRVIEKNGAGLLLKDAHRCQIRRGAAVIESAETE